MEGRGSVRPGGPYNEAAGWISTQSFVDLYAGPVIVLIRA